MWNLIFVMACMLCYVMLFVDKKVSSKFFTDTIFNFNFLAYKLYASITYVCYDLK